ncbi:MAG: tRNA (N6-threonylcarbamoyladenosine(37)-N6)-methyltransferase TrmO [Candidatus Bathyarchaeia archaeon]
MRGKGEVKFIGLVEDADELSRVRIFPEFCPGLQGLERFSHIIILYWFHLRDREDDRRVLQVVPRRHPGAPQVGVFASRSPSRSNPIGLCVTELVKIQDCTLLVRALDASEGSPVIDIKPYIPRNDSIPDARVPEWTSHGPQT